VTNPVKPRPGLDALTAATSGRQRDDWHPGRYNTATFRAARWQPGSDDEHAVWGDHLAGDLVLGAGGRIEISD